MKVTSQNETVFDFILRKMHINEIAEMHEI